MGMSNLVVNINLLQDIDRCLLLTICNLGDKNPQLKTDFNHSYNTHVAIQSFDFVITGSTHLKELYGAILADAQFESRWKNYSLQLTDTPPQLKLTYCLLEEARNNKAIGLEKHCFLSMLEQVHRRQVIANKVQKILYARLRQLTQETAESYDSLAPQMTFGRHYANLEIMFPTNNSAALQRLRSELEAAGCKEQTAQEIIFYGKQELKKNAEGNIEDSYFKIANTANQLVRNYGLDEDLLISTPTDPLHAKELWVRRSINPDKPSGIEV